MLRAACTWTQGLHARRMREKPTTEEELINKSRLSSGDLFSIRGGATGAKCMRVSNERADQRAAGEAQSLRKAQDKPERVAAAASELSATGNKLIK